MSANDHHLENGRRTLEWLLQDLIIVHVIENQQALLEDVVIPIDRIFDLHRQRVGRAIFNHAENLCVVKVDRRNVHLPGGLTSCIAGARYSCARPSTCSC